MAITTGYQVGGLYLPTGPNYQVSTLGQQGPIQGPIRNALSERCAAAVFRFNGKKNLSDLAKEMPGDYDQNRKLLSDVFLLSACHMTLEQAASLAFVLREEVGGFIELCEQHGALIPSGE